MLGEASFAPRAARPEAANQDTSSRPLTCRAICAEAPQDRAGAGCGAAGWPAPAIRSKARRQSGETPQNAIPHAKNKGPEGPCEDVESRLFHAKQVVEHVLDRAINEPLARVPIRRVVAGLEGEVEIADRRLRVYQILDAQGQRRVLESGVDALHVPKGHAAHFAWVAVRTRCVIEVTALVCVGDRC